MRLTTTLYTVLFSILLLNISTQISQACSSINLDIQFDNYPGQISWEVLDSDNNIVANSATYYNAVQANTNTTENLCLPNGCYTLNFKDTMGNGMCQGSNSSTTTSTSTINTSGSIIGTMGMSTSPSLCGNYKLTDSGGTTLVSGGGNFGTQQSTDFCINTPICNALDLDIQFGNAPTQNSWEVTDANDNIVASSTGYNNLAANANTTDNVCLPDGCYTLSFKNSMGSGMCQNSTTTTSTNTMYTTGSGTIIGTTGMSTSPSLCGNYRLVDANGTILVSGGGNFGNQQDTDFCISSDVESRLDNNNTELLIKDKINVYPTMASDFVNVEFDFDSETNINLVIYDINGKMVDQYLNQTIYANENMQLDIANLNRGNYFIKLNSFGNIVTKRFVKF